MLAFNCPVIDPRGAAMKACMAHGDCVQHVAYAPSGVNQPRQSRTTSSHEPVDDPIILLHYFWPDDFMVRCLPLPYLAKEPSKISNDKARP